MIHSRKQWWTLFMTSSNSCLDIPSITASVWVFWSPKSFARLWNTLLFTYPHKKIIGCWNYIGAPGWPRKSRPMRDYTFIEFLFQDPQNHIRAMFSNPSWNHAFFITTHFQPDSEKENSLTCSHSIQHSLLLYSCHHL